MKKSALIVFFSLLSCCMYAQKAVHITGPRGGTHGHTSGGSGSHGAHASSHVIFISGHSHSTCSPDAFEALRSKIYNGYIVYGSDTMQGVIVCADNIVSIKTDPAQDSTYMYGIEDTSLKLVMLQDNGKALELQRVGNNKLYRVLHSGALSLYDAYFSFDYNNKEFFNVDSWAIYAGHSEELNTFWTMSVKRKLVSTINKAYGLALDPNAYSKEDLLAYLQKLE